MEKEILWFMLYVQDMCWFLLSKQKLFGLEFLKEIYPYDYEIFVIGTNFSTNGYFKKKWLFFFKEKKIVCLNVLLRIF